MALALWAALQAAAGPAGAVPVDFDLARVKPAADQGCDSDTPSEIIVCGRRALRNDYPIEKMAQRYREKPLRAEMGLGGGATGGIYLDQAEMPGGQVARRIMFGIKMPF